MRNFKVRSPKDHGEFVVTPSYQKLIHKFKELKKSKGHFIHVIGTPGTGKSANIYNALSLLDLNVYNAFLFLDDVNLSNNEVYRIFWQTLKDDLGVKTQREVFQKVAEYDLVLFADPFLDSEFLDEEKVGLSLWTENKGPSSFTFYFKILLDYFKYRKDLKNVNIVTQTSWTIKYKETRYDLLTDFSLLSDLVVFLLKQLFEVVQISYSIEETVEIVKNQNPHVAEEQIRRLIKRYGCRPRFILEELEEEAT